MAAQRSPKPFVGVRVPPGMPNLVKTINKNMAIYKFIDLENQEVITEKLYDFAVNSTDIFKTGRSWTPIPASTILSNVPELATALSKFINLSIDICAFVYRPPGYEEAHLDGIVETRLLMPIYNCQGSYTKFYDLNGNEVTRQVEPKGNVWWKIGNKFPLIEIDRLELTRPVFFNAGVPHGVQTPPGNGPRLSFTCSFKGDASHLIE